MQRLGTAYSVQGKKYYNRLPNTYIKKDKFLINYSNTIPLITKKRLKERSTVGQSFATRSCTSYGHGCYPPQFLFSKYSNSLREAYKYIIFMEFK